MNKQDIIEHLTHNCGLHRASAIAAVNGIIEAMTNSLKRREDVTLRGFAALRLKDIPKRIGRNPSTGESISIPAHTSVRLVLSKELKSTLNPE